MLNYVITRVPIYIDREPRHVVLYDEYNKLNNSYYTLLNEHALILELIKTEHNTLVKSVEDLTEGTVPDNSVTAAKLTDNSVTKDKIVNEAVTNDKLAGEISFSKLKQPSMAHLYKYMEVTGFSEDEYYNFETITAYCITATSASTAGYPQGLKLSFSINIPMPEDILGCLIYDSILFSEPHSKHKLILLEKDKSFKKEGGFLFGVNDRIITTSNKFMDLYVIFNTFSGKEYELNTEVDSTHIYDKTNNIAYPCHFSDGCYQGNSGAFSAGTTYPAFTCSLLKQNNQYYLSFNFDIYIFFESGEHDYYKSTEVNKIKIKFKKYPILPLY